MGEVISAEGGGWALSGKEDKEEHEEDEEGGEKKRRKKKKKEEKKMEKEKKKKTKNKKAKKEKKDRRRMVHPSSLHFCLSFPQVCWVVSGENVHSYSDKTNVSSFSYMALLSE